MRLFLSNSAPVTVSVVNSGEARAKANAYEDAINLLGGIESNLFVPLEGGGVKVEALQTLQDETRRKTKALRDCIEDLDLQLGDARRDLKRANKLKATVISENNALRQKTTVSGYERLREKLEEAQEALEIAEQEASTASLREGEAKRELERVEEERRIATEGLHSARGEEVQLRQLSAKQTESIRELLDTRSALRQDVELLSRENELQTSSIIAYMFVVQRLRGCLRAFLDFYKAQIKAVGQIETGEYANLGPEKAGKSPQAYALDLCYEMKPIAESARTMGEDELQLLDKACPSFKMSTTEGLTEY
jgi:regulator of replication initiation timing